MSPATLERIAATYTAVSAANRRACSGLTAVLEQFQTRRIDAILLKGADVLPRLYGAWGARPMADVDLLVRAEDLPAIHRMLLGLGFVQVIDGNPAYAAPDNSLILDLTTDIWYAANTDAIWRRAIIRRIMGVPIKAMGSEDLLLYLTAYAVLHRGAFPPSYSRDITLLLQKEPLNWTVVFDEAVRTRLTIPLYYGLSHVARCVPGTVPSQVLARLAPTTWTERVWLTILRKLVTEAPLDGLGHLLLLASLPGVKRWRRLKRTLWPPSDFLRCRYGERSMANPTRTRIVRIAQLAVQATSLLARVLWRLTR